MRKEYIILTEEQIEKLEEARKGMKEFYLLAQPVISSRVMTVLVLTVSEADKLHRFFKRSGFYKKAQTAHKRKVK